MKIEFGFQANCSELVTHLGPRSPEEVAAGMKKIAELTKGSWQIELPGEENTVPLPLEALVMGDGNAALRLDASLVIPKLKALLSGEQLQALQQASGSGIEPKLMLDGEDEGIILEYDCWCGEDQLHLAIDASSFPEMPLFHWLRSQFKADALPHDGGSPLPYLAWLAYHYMNKDTVMSLLEDDFEQDDIEDWVLKEIKENPPLPGSLPPDDLDKSIMGSFVELEDAGQEEKAEREEEKHYSEKEPLSPWAPQPEGKQKKKPQPREETKEPEEKPVKKKKGFLSRLFGGK